MSDNLGDTAPPPEIDMVEVNEAVVEVKEQTPVPDALEEPATVRDNSQEQLGDAEVAIPDMVRVVTCDGFEFLLPRHTVLSPVLRRTFQVNAGKPDGDTHHLETVDGATMHCLVEYWFYKLRYPLGTTRPQFDVPEDLALRLMAAADLLQT
ncbi:Transcription elongation factor B polypeptide 1 [Carpediemonas membranifera]|uniref:Transcription elongation factor B polypeptide 1 n=1 Tax=Carpediemonas membranifera TaxID=201153 RepID=A0A8J6E0F8_9EUKA|nr:Transcription elongation factor B polypeptide 1 [Carpediemonas membranifera]|eukprot:KAG9395064.1 Transcription elongation factor B polypeptide 1 [Carpediemonas membranifera]